MIYYSVAKEGRYKKDDNDEYMDCALAVKVNGKDKANDEETIEKAKEMREWLSKQINVFPIHLKPITRSEYERIE